MPASEEAAGGESALPPFPILRPHPPLAGSGSWAGGSRAPPLLPDPLRDRRGSRALSPLLAPSSWHLGTPNSSPPSVPQDPRVTGAGGRARTGQVLSAVPPSQDPDNGIPRAPRPCPPDPEPDRMGTGGRSTFLHRGRLGSHRPRVSSPPPVPEGRSSQEPGESEPGARRRGSRPSGGRGRRRRLPGPLPSSLC